MSGELITLGLSSMALLFVAGLFALFYQYWRNWFIRSIILLLATLSAVGFLVFLAAIIIPAESTARLFYGVFSYQGLTSAISIGIILGLSIWREQQDQAQAASAQPNPSVDHSPKRRVYLEHVLRPRKSPQKPRRRRPKSPPRHSAQRVGTPTHYRVNRPRRKPNSTAHPSRSAATNQRAAVNLNNHWSRLDALTHDSRTSKRLVRGNLQKNPGCSPGWAIEKAINDIERDRRS